MTFRTKEEEPCLQVTHSKELGSPGRIRTSNISVNSSYPPLRGGCTSLKLF